MGDPSACSWSAMDTSVWWMIASVMIILTPGVIYTVAALVKYSKWDAGWIAYYAADHRPRPTIIRSQSLPDYFSMVSVTSDKQKERPKARTCYLIEWIAWPAMMVAYLTVWVIHSFAGTTPFGSLSRSGTMAMVQLPIVFLSGVRNGMLLPLLSYSYERVSLSLRSILQD